MARPEDHPTGFAISPPKVPSVAILDSDQRFPVRRIFCVGQNYAEHVREMGHDPNREAPFFFSKPADSLVEDGARLPYPPATGELHHEAELVVVIGTGGSNIASGAALAHVWGYGPGNDLTRRDLQAAARQKSRPWDMAKGFDNAAVCGALTPVERCGHPEFARITAVVNGETRQQSDIAHMIWSVADVIAHLSALVSLAPGDLIYTGTPAGVGPLRPGDHCRVEVTGLGAVGISIA